MSYPVSPKRRRFAVSSLALLLGAVAGCGEDADRGSSAARPNVLIVSVDTLRADHLGCYGYSPYAEPVSPAIDALAAEGLCCDAFFTPRGQTGPSLSSMLTGLYPSNHGLLDNFEGLRDEGSDLVDDFVALGYEAHGFVSYFPVKKTTRHALAFARFAPQRGSWFDAKPQMPGERTERWDDAVEHAFLDFLKQRKSGGRPFFSWIHFYDVHQPYSPPPRFHAAFAGDYHGTLRIDPAPTESAFNARIKSHLDEKMRARTPLDPADARYVTALYDGGIRATDERIGRIVGALRAAKLLDSTLICITADHGEELADHNGFWFHGNSVYDAVLRIPLIVRGPGVKAGRFGDLMQNVDLLPTLLDHVGGTVPAGLDGASFAEVLRGGRPEAPIREIAWAEWQNLILSARTPRWKFILNPRGARPKLPPFERPEDPGYFVECRELYDVGADPREQRNLWREQRATIDELRLQVGDEYSRRFAALVSGAADRVDPADREQLLELGYVGDDEQDYRLEPGACDD